MSDLDWTAMPAVYHVDREQLDALLSMPYDEPDMADVERVCDEVRHVQPVPRTLCLALSDDRSLPLQCRFKLDHSGGHDWEMERGVLTDFRAKQLREEQGTPSGMLPVRSPGEALHRALAEEAEERTDGDVHVPGALRRESVGPRDHREAAGPLEGEFEREVLETWTA